MKRTKNIKNRVAQVKRSGREVRKVSQTKMKHFFTKKVLSVHEIKYSNAVVCNC